MSSDDELDHSSFLDGLQDIGLFDSNVKGVKKVPPNNKKSQPKKNQGQRGRPPTRIRAPLDLDALLDGIEPKTSSVPKEEPSLKKIQAETTKEKYEKIIPSKPEPSKQLDSIEQSITSYLQRSLKLVLNEFLIDLTNILKDSDNFDKIVDLFIDSLRDTIRHELLFQTNSINSEIDIPAIFSDYEASFIDILEKVSCAKQLSYQDKLKKSRKSRTTLNSLAPSIINQLTDSLSEVSAEVKSLNLERAQDMNILADSIRNQESIFKKGIYLDQRNIEIGIESETLSRQLSRLDEKRQHLEEQDLILEQDYDDKIRTSVKSLQEQIMKNKSQKSHSQSMQIEEARSELAIYRNLYSYQLQLLQKQASLMSISHPPSFQPNGLSMTMAAIPFQEKVRPEIVEQSLFQNIDDDLNSFTHSKQRELEKSKENRRKEIELTRAVDKRLQAMQEQRENSLQEVSAYISKIKRGEKSRQFMSHLTLDSFS